MQDARVTEARIAYAAVALGAESAAAISGWNAYFLANFLFMWGSQAALCLLLLALRARPAVIAVIAGTSLATTVHLALFCLWVTTLPTREGAMAWLGYVFALPGGGCAALLMATRIDKKHAGSRTLLLSLGITLAGLALNQGLVCATLLHCGR